MSRTKKKYSNGQSRNGGNQQRLSGRKRYRGKTEDEKLFEQMRTKGSAA